MMLKLPIFLLSILAIFSVNIATAKEQNFCQGCRAIVSFVSQLNQTRGQFDSALTNYCKSLPGSTDYKGSCLYVAHKFLSVVDHMDPVHHCDQIGACGKVDPPKEQQSVVTDNVFCGICTDSVNSFKEALTDPKTVDSIKDTIRSACNALDVIHAKDECNTLLDKYLNQLLAFVRGIDARQYCTSIQLCSNGNLAASVAAPSLEELMGIGRVSKVMIEKKPTSMPNFGNLDCVLCKRIVKQLKTMLSDKPTEAEIEDALEKVCKLIYKSQTKLAQCDEMVNKYVDEFIHILVDEADPDMVCVLLNMCKYQNGTQVDFSDLLSALDQTFDSSSDVCHECEMFVHFIQTRLWDVVDINQLERELKTKICNRLPTQDLQQTCNSFVDQYLRDLFRAIIEQLDPKAVCADMKACDKVEPVEVIESSKYCDTCVQVVTTIDEYLANKPVEKDITHFVEEVCGQLPEDSKHECKMIVETFGPEIIKMISSMTDPKKVCSEIRLCHAPGTPKMLGLAKCSFGPGYWCLSDDHARACSARDYCRRKVWRAISN